MLCVFELVATTGKTYLGIFEAGYTRRVSTNPQPKFDINMTA